MNPGFRKKTAQLLLPLAVLLAAMLALSALFPVTGDDWYRETIGAQLHSPGDLISLLAQKWKTTNPRLMGNLLAYCAGGRRVLRAALRGGLLLLLVLAAARNTGRRTAGRLLLTGAFLLLLPQDMFAQVYPWGAGFFNYVPPVITVLLFLAAAEPVFDRRPMRDTPALALAVFLLGFVGQLFIEHSTLYALLASFALLVWYFWEQRRLSAVLLANAAGCVLGAALLFLSPAYQTIGETDNAYTMGQSLRALLDTVRENLPELLADLLEGSPVLYLSLAALCMFLFLVRQKKSRADFVLLVPVLGMAVWYFSCQYCGLPLPGLKGRLLAAAIWFLSLLLAFVRWLPAGVYRRRAVFFHLSAAAAAAPLAVVSPIGERCLFLSYVLLLLAAGNLLSAGLERVRLPRGLGTLLAGVLFAVVWLRLFRIYLPIHQAELARQAAIAQAMSRGETEISVEPYPNGDWLWEPESQKLGEQYYYETPHDIIFTILDEG